MNTDKARIPYPDPEKMYLFYETQFNESTERAIRVSIVHDNDKISDLLEILEGAIFTGDSQSMEGATYKSMAFLAHQFGLDDDERQELYRIARWVPLSQSHISFMTKATIERNQLHADLEKMAEGGI